MANTETHLTPTPTTTEENSGWDVKSNETILATAVDDNKLLQNADKYILIAQA